MIFDHPSQPFFLVESVSTLYPMTLETIQGNLYDYPKYYDLVYGSDWKAEFDFLEDCFEKHADVTIERVYEPACGTGRLLVKFADAGYQIGGIDLNPKAVDYCNDRLDRNGYARAATVGDMADFCTAKPIDAAFNTINSFRHLATETQARRHLECVAKALRPGGIYVLGLHLTPTEIEPMQEESWSARRGNLAVISHLWVTDCDLQCRRETVGMSFDIYSPTRQFRIKDEVHFRTYTHLQMADLLRSIGTFDVTECYDFSYDISNPLEVGPASEDVVYVLKKRAL